MDKQKLIKMSKDIHDSKIRNCGKFKSLLQNMNAMKALEVYDAIILMCLEEGVDCQVLIDEAVKFKAGEITESEFKKAINFALM